MAKKIFFSLIFIIIIIFSINKFSLIEEKSENNINELEICKNCNVVLIVIDTLRADHVSLLGYEKETTPNLDRFLEKSYIFENNYSVSSWTLPSMMSMLTGTYPMQHKINNKYSAQFPTRITDLNHESPYLETMASFFENKGYATAGFTGGAGIKQDFGFNKGFNTYEDKVDFAGFETTSPMAIEWLDTHKEKPHFLLLHGYNVHGQYLYNENVDRKWSASYEGDLKGSIEEHIELRDESIKKDNLFVNEEDREFLINRYDDKIFNMDKQLDQFIKEYEQLAFEQPTIFIITSDHGEELFDHGKIDHGHSLYDELIKTPLMIKMPNQDKQYKINSMSRSIDLMPTIMELLGHSSEKNEQFDGISILPIMNGEKIDQEILLHTNYRHSVSLRGGINKKQEKIIYDLMNKNSKFFDLKKDPKEQDNINKNTEYDDTYNWLKNNFWEIEWNMSLSK